MSQIETESRDDRAAVDKAFALLKAFNGDVHEQVGVSEIARRAQLRKSTAFRLLTMLERNGVLEKSGTRYRLGQTLFEIGVQSASAAHDSLREVLLPFLVDIYEATRQNVQLATVTGTEVVYLSKVHGHHAARSPIRVGVQLPAYCTAVGKVLLASNPDVMAIALAEPRRKWTKNTLTGQAELRAELEQVRRVGIAFDRAEAFSDLYCLAVPVWGEGGVPVAAISISSTAATIGSSQFESVLRRVSFRASRELMARSSTQVPARNVA